MRLRLSVFAALTTVPTSLMLASCVADTAVPSPGVDASPDTNTADTSAVDAPSDTSSLDAGDAAVPSCYGQPFGALNALTTTAPDGGGWFSAWTPRVFNSSTVYFAAGPVGELDIYRANFPGSSGGVMTGVTLVPGVSAPGIIDWPLAIAPSGAYVVYGRGPTAVVTNRDLWLATGSTNNWQNPTKIPTATINTPLDETEAWLAGNPPTALYFTRSATDLNTGNIYRSAVLNQTPTFDAPQPVVNCPAGVCATPVTTPDEKTLFYATWPSAATYFNSVVVQEATLKSVNGVLTAGTPIAHPELGAHYPSWVSADGCQILVANGQPSKLAVSTRTPK